MPDRTCCIDGCDKLASRRGWCRGHYDRHRKYGDPLAGKPTPGFATAFISAAATSSTDECIEWPYFRTPDGYGQLSIGGHTTKTHRAVLLLVAGPPPQPGMDAAHTPLICHNRACVNPRHLRWATKVDQSNDMVIDGTRENQRQTKLTEADVRQIRGDGRVAREIAADHGISAGYVSQIKHRITWAHLD